METPQCTITYVPHKQASDTVEQLLVSPVRAWVSETIGTINLVQQLSIPRIIENQSTLVTAPTGSGKTLAAFLGIISELHRLETEGSLKKQIYALYISPLKALNNDIFKNLELPLNNLKQQVDSKITLGKRTGDTSTKERQRLLRSPPHILITTPESLGLMLAAPKFKTHLRQIKWLVLDEIHSLADNKRGTLLTLCLERLEHYLARDLTRIGLSATVQPIEEIARFLIGNRSVEVGIIDLGGLRELEIDVRSPVPNLMHAPYQVVEKEQLAILNEEVAKNRTTLIFTNTRHMSERLMYKLVDLMPEEFADKIAVHHGSLDKEVRIDVEEQLKQGNMRAVFTSTSLEMGIDIGSIDLTIQIGSPKTVSALLQRIGRSGHSQSLVSKGIIIPYNRDDLLECIAIARLAEQGAIDAIRIPEAPTDVLMQMLIGMGLEQKWEISEAYSVVTKAYPYRNLSFEAFIHILKRAADPTQDEHSWKYGHIWVEEEINEFGKRKSARQAYLQNIGTIPDSTAIDVILQGFRTTIGQVTEKFAEQLQDSDIFLLGGRSYQYIRAIGNKILVQDASGMVPTVPSWGGGPKTRTVEVSREIQRIFKRVEQFLDTEAKEEAQGWLQEEYPISSVEAQVIIEYLLEQRSMAVIPKLNKLIVENYLDPSGFSNILILSIWGLATNQALAQYLASNVSQRVGIHVGYSCKDNGLQLRIPPGVNFDYQTLFTGLEYQYFQSQIKASLQETELFKNRFRHVLGRSLVILRRWGKQSIGVMQQQRTARWLLKTLQDTVYTEETFREILEDTFDVHQAEQVLQQVLNSHIAVEFIPESTIPSSMTHDLILNGELDIVSMQDQRSLLLSLHKQVISRLLPELEQYRSILDIDAVNTYYAEKLHGKSLEQTIHLWCKVPQLTIDFISDLSQQLQVSSEEITTVLSADDLFGVDQTYVDYSLLPFVGAIRGSDFWTGFDQDNPDIQIAIDRSAQISPELAWEHLITELLTYLGPRTAQEVADYLGTTTEHIVPAIKRMQRRHMILQGEFTEEKTQYILADDREQITREFRDTDTITEEELRAFRLRKMGLTQETVLLNIEDYLQFMGPARDAVEMLARMPSFTWEDLRLLLAQRRVYFGRFLGRRLVFIHQEHLPDFIRITRSNEPLQDMDQQVLVLLSERPGLTAKEITHLLQQTHSVIKATLTRLEQDLYISRTGMELSLVHGGFPNPRYIPLPEVNISPEYYSNAVQSIIQRCVTWYGPLSLNDLLRITKLPYPTLEANLAETELVSRNFFGTWYYGQQSDFDELQEHGEAVPQNLHLLSSLDPYFYMVSGSFRASSLPRQSRLTILRSGRVSGYIHISIPDRDMLQVLNIQLSQVNSRDFAFIKQIGSKLRDIALQAYRLPVVFIEEINYKPVTDQQNRLIVQAFQEIGFSLEVDHLEVGTTGLSSISDHDIVSTRIIYQQERKEKQYTTIDDFLQDHQIFTAEMLYSQVQGKHSDLQLLLSNFLRRGALHYRDRKLYTHDLFSSLFGTQATVTNDQVLVQLHKPMTISGLAAALDRDRTEVQQLVRELLDQGVIEVVSPFTPVPEFRAMPSRDGRIDDQLTALVLFFISDQGPIDFAALLTRLDQYLEVNRFQVLLTLTELLQSKQVLLASTDNKRLVYLTTGQEKILRDPLKAQRLKDWLLLSIDDLYLEEKSSGDTHVLVYEGQAFARLQVTMEGDTVIIENMTILDSMIHELDKIIETEIFDQLEAFAFQEGYLNLQINKIQGNTPRYWTGLEEGEIDANTD